MPTKLCNAAQPGRRERVSALKLGAALAASLWLVSEVSPVFAQSATAVTGPEISDAPTAKAENTTAPIPTAVTGDAVALPPVANPPGAARPAQLNVEDARRYRDIFALLRRGDWDSADREIPKLQDKRLLGYVQAQRLLHPDVKAGYGDLAGWMQRYADLAIAERIHTLAERRKPAGGPRLISPRGGPSKLPAEGDLERLAGYRPTLNGLFAAVANRDDGAPRPANVRPADDAGEQQPALRVAPRSRNLASRAPSEAERNQARIDALLQQGDAKAAWDLLSSDAVALSMDRAEFDAARSRIADSFYQAGELAQALALASASAAGASNTAMQANWTAGLAAWRAKRYDRAARHFEAVVESRPNSPWKASAAAFWAGRAQLKANQPDRARVNLAAAARFPHTFYGLVAQRTLGEQPQLQWRPPVLTAAHLAAVAKSPAGARAVALLQVGENDLAEQELRRVNPARGGKLLQEALLGLAERGGMAEMALQLGNTVAGPDGAAYDSALYPLPHWKPRNGFAVDRALLFAIARQESRFDARLVAHTGASGLMQIMPATARFVRNHSDDIDDAGRGALLDPAANLELGQRYIADLMQMPAVGDNLFYLGAAYNAGPGNLVRWRKQFRDVKDPLLFIESLPFGETRDYQEKLLANYWIYRLRLGQDVSSLDDVAAGRWPRYTPVEARAGLLQPAAAVSEDAED